MARKEFTEEEIAILKTSPHVMDVSPAIIHFNAAFKELFWKKLLAGMEPAAIFREADIDPDMLGKTRVEGFKGMLKAEVKRGKGFRDLTTSNEFYAKNMTAEQRIAYLEQQLEYLPFCFPSIFYNLEVFPVPEFLPEELNLIYLYDPGNLHGLIYELRSMMAVLMPDENELRNLAQGVITKLGESYP